jgi:enamine deaminase RidA (YjgF/YER057c/UK114 family)
MERKPINPWTWSTNLGFDQAHLIEGHKRQLIVSGQDAVDAEGNPQHPGDMSGQLEMALDNLEAILAAADMTFANVVRLNVYATDLDEYLKHFGSLNARFENAGGRYVTSLLGVNQLPAGLLVMLEATAVD